MPGSYSPDRILTSHAGSLPRPPALVELFARRSRGDAVDPAELDQRIAEATRWVIPKQLAAGIDLPSNGEQPREAFFLYVRHRMSGFGGSGSRPPLQDVARYPIFSEMRQRQMAAGTAVSNFEPPKVIGPVAYLDRAVIERECGDFRAVLDAQPADVPDAFMTAPSPGIIAAAVPNEHYDSEQAYVDALAEALRVEYEAIVDHGFILQLDCPDLALEGHVTYADRPIGDFVGFVEMIVAAINRSLVNVPRERVRMHVCWGNYEGPHDCDVELAEILPALLQADVGGYLLPFANPRHAHDYSIFRGGVLADDQYLVAGVIDTTTNYVEHPRVVADRIVRVAEALGDPGRVLAATDCGFDTSAGMGRVAEDVVWAKLEALSEGARLASEKLF
ncbi:MAG: cobalamin-independent methionine synthase II family protein [Alphaproteobacteria bacterium]|jgi:5-methyltetrahydropteroyltriglutamate--homocysteine methyltransferase|nr:cobalamin-independent methionine synthase II family protein [Alphaproteobacteria bacterium]MDP6565592.1 cobalamin-independent methionine synthase II family protein [Alphaproteobacteria bacterium]MDP6814631.1 cobalamin-independent methionine synthase II family protein [Alphaproteobacteria bacterium]